jgi:hypothetical protein
MNFRGSTKEIIDGKTIKIPGRVSDKNQPFLFLLWA